MKEPVIHQRIPCKGQVAYYKKRTANQAILIYETDEQSIIIKPHDPTLQFVSIIISLLLGFKLEIKTYLRSVYTCIKQASDLNKVGTGRSVKENYRSSPWQHTVHFLF